VSSSEKPKRLSSPYSLLLIATLPEQGHRKPADNLSGASDCDVEFDDEMSEASVRELFGAFSRYR
jgi:hypothetical protein